MSFSTPLSLIIRFSLPIADLPLTVSSPSTTTAQSLNAQIRPHLPPEYSSYPLRLIAAGALLPSNVPLSVSLRLPSSPPSPASKSLSTTPSPTPPPQSPPIYIHCAPTTTATPLSPSALQAEKTSHLAPFLSSSSISSASAANLPAQQQPQPQAPLGFDRLLSAGLTTTEIASLRSQFLAQTQHMHTPDTMPSAAELRVLEERWLDDSASGGGAMGDGGGVGGAGEGDEGEAGGLEDMLWGNVMGFFWAVGGLIWLAREEGVWSRRRQVGVVTGVLVNIAFGVFRVTG